VTKSSPANSESPPLNVEGDLVALGPLRRDLIITYQRWFNDFETLRTLNVIPRPITLEQELAWYDGQVTREDAVHFTVYERATMRPIGSTTLTSVSSVGAGNVASWRDGGGMRSRCSA
jgi:hypothetical protein